MNIERIDDAIRIMQNAKNLDMLSFQGSGHDRGRGCSSIDDLHACGNTACFAGYVALSPMFQDAGGRIGPLGAPVFNGSHGSEAIADYLNISEFCANCLVFGEEGEFEFEYELEDKHSFYPVPFDSVTPEHVIDKLEMIKRGELV